MRESNCLAKNTILLLTFMVSLGAAFMLAQYLSDTRGSDIFPSTILSLGSTYFVMISAYMLALQPRVLGLPGYMLAYIGGIAFGAPGLWMYLKDSEGIPQEVAIMIGASISSLAFIVPFERGDFTFTKSKPDVKDKTQEKKQPEVVRNPLDFFKNFLTYRLGPEFIFEMISLEDIFPQNASNGVLWAKEVLLPSEDKFAAVIECYKLAKGDKNALTVGELAMVFKAYLTREEDLRFTSVSGLLRDLRKNLETNKCPGKFFLGHPDGVGVIYGIIYDKHHGVLITYQRSVQSILEEQRRNG